MKNLNDILFIIQARTNSERVPNKMLRPFAGTNLFDIALKKIKQTKIPLENFRASVYEPELIKVVEENNLLYFKRSYESANSDNSLESIYEWHSKFEHKYVIIINACNLFLRPQTIDLFIDTYCNSDKPGLFGVIPKKQYYWNSSKELQTTWPEGCNIMNTKAVEQTYEAAHVLYAGEREAIADGYWMAPAPFKANNPELFDIEEFESLDIDHDWQFDIYTSYWEKVNG